MLRRRHAAKEHRPSCKCSGRALVAVGCIQTHHVSGIERLPEHATRKARARGGRDPVSSSRVQIPCPNLAAEFSGTAQFRSRRRASPPIRHGRDGPRSPLGSYLRVLARTGILRSHPIHNPAVRGPGLRLSPTSRLSTGLPQRFIPEVCGGSFGDKYGANLRVWTYRRRLSRPVSQ